MVLPFKALLGIISDAKGDEMTIIRRVRFSKSRAGMTWVAAFLLFSGLECMVCWSQFVRHTYALQSLEFFSLPLVLTLPMSIGGGLYLRRRAKWLIAGNETIGESVSEFVAVVIVISYLTAFCCLARFV